MLDPVVEPAFYSVDSTSDSNSVSCDSMPESRTTRSKTGVVLRSHWEELMDKRVKVCECMMRSPKSDPTSYVFEQVAGYLAAKKLSFVLLVKDDECGPHSYMAMATTPPKRPHHIFLFIFFYYSSYFNIKV